MEDNQFTLAANLEAARKAAGNPSFNTLSREMFAQIGDAPDGQTFMQYHKGRVKKVDTRVVAWLAVRYDVPVSDLSPTMGKQAVALKKVLARIRCNEENAGGRARGPGSTSARAA